MTLIDFAYVLAGAVLIATGVINVLCGIHNAEVAANNLTDARINERNARENASAAAYLLARQAKPANAVSGTKDALNTDKEGSGT